MLRIHAFSRVHSVFDIHSGRQPIYGSPSYSDIHEQMPFEQFAFGPHGVGLQESTDSTAI